MSFYNRLNYSIGNEDWSVESQALRVNAGDTVVCVTASGDRPLHLLMTECSAIHSVDMNQTQNFLLELKIAALAKLDYEKYLAFLGCHACENRLDIYNEIKSQLSPAAMHYWDANKKMLQRGVIYQGKVERLTHFSAKILKTIRAEKINTLFSFTDINLQREYISAHWDTYFWRKLLEVFLNTNALKIILNDPGLSAYVDPSIKPGQYIYERMLQYLDNNLASSSALLQLVFLGEVLPSAYFPYLTYVGYKKIRHNMHRLHYQTGNIIEFLTNHEQGKINGFSLSDIASYMPQPAFEKLLMGIASAAAPGARFCLREFMSKKIIPADLQASFKRDNELEQHLEKTESNFVYRFLAGEIQK